MKCKTAVGFLMVFFVAVSFAYAEEWVTFEGTSKKDEQFMLKGMGLSKTSPIHSDLIAGRFEAGHFGESHQ